MKTPEQIKNSFGYKVWSGVDKILSKKISDYERGKAEGDKAGYLRGLKEGWEKRQKEFELNGCGYVGLNLVLRDARREGHQELFSFWLERSDCTAREDFAFEAKKKFGVKEILPAKNRRYSVLDEGTKMNVDGKEVFVTGPVGEGEEETKIN